MKAETVLTFRPDGTAQGLYTEAIALHELGRLSIRRATTIEFDDAAQNWVVRDSSGAKHYQSPSRQSCLDWEREHFNNHEETQT